ncbi:MAG: hypothetical protein NC396_05150 [Bacteroides sp.]|nr:hypothetical protein [Bacteroides sp.]MCM1085745.1 hypothetical protein [Bacteroides sp.]
MKKVLFAAALLAAFGINAACANTVSATKTQISVTAEDPFKTIEADQLPQAVKDAVAKNYEGQTIKVAYVKEEGENKTYKVTLSAADDKTSDVFFNEQGEVLPGEEKM